MTAPATPRTGLFQRKPASKGPASAQSDPKPGAGESQDGPPPATGQDDGSGAEPVTCPQCGCQFDASDPSVQGDGQAAPMGGAPDAGAPGGGGDLGATIAAMMQRGGGPQASMGGM